MNDFKPGDRVTYVHAPANTWEVLAVREDWVWALREGHSMPGTYPAADFRPAPPPFFEEGKKYTREAGWSILAQASDVTERFLCQAVRTNSNGGRAAFGYLTAGGEGRWAILGPYDYESQGWTGDPE